MSLLRRRNMLNSNAETSETWDYEFYPENVQNQFVQRYIPVKKGDVVKIKYFAVRDTDGKTGYLVDGRNCGTGYIHGRFNGMSPMCYDSEQTITIDIFIAGRLCFCGNRGFPDFEGKIPNSTDVFTGKYVKVKIEKR